MVLIGSSISVFLFIRTQMLTNQFRYSTFLVEVRGNYPIKGEFGLSSRLITGEYWFLLYIVKAENISPYLS